jgi:hypothetical protein
MKKRECTFNSNLAHRNDRGPRAGREQARVSRLGPIILTKSRLSTYRELSLGAKHEQTHTALHVTQHLSFERHDHDETLCRLQRRRLPEEEQTSTMIQSCVPLATNVVTLFFVEVTPLILVSDDDVPREQELPSLTAPLVKRHLQLRTFRSIRGKHDFHFRWEKSVQDDSKHKAESSGVESDSRAVLPSCGSFVSTEHQDGSNRPGWAALGRGKQAIPVVYIPSDSPTDLEPCPCLVVGYGYLPHTSTAAPDSLEATVSEATLLRVLPVEYAVPVGTAFGHSQTKLSLDSMLSWKESLLGELSDHPLSDSFQEEVLSNHSKETVNALTLRMRMLLSNDVCIGSSFNSIQEQQKGRQRRGRLQDAMNHYRRAKQGDATATIPCTSKQGDSAFLALADKRSLLSEGGLVVHSPHHGAGKTLLVKTIALRNLKCDSVHVIRPGAMLAKYGVNTDSGLETLLHSICMSAACRGQSICIILDHLDAMMPPKFSGRHGAGDAAVPILNATGKRGQRQAYFNLLTA